VTIIVDLKPEIERGLQAQAQAKRISLTDYVNEIVAREASATMAKAVPRPPTGQALLDVCADIRGLLSDEEIDLMFARNRSGSRPLEL